jgi:hypothetical protein
MLNMLNYINPNPNVNVKNKIIIKLSFVVPNYYQKSVITYLLNFNI